MFNLLASWPKFYEFCWCCCEDGGMQKIIKSDSEPCHWGVADWLWPPAKKDLIGCWPLKATARLFAGFGLVIALNCNTDISNQWLKDTLGCLQLIWLCICVSVVCVCVWAKQFDRFMSWMKKYTCVCLNYKLWLPLSRVSHPHTETLSAALFAKINFRCFQGIKMSQPRRREKQIQDQNTAVIVLCGVSANITELCDTSVSRGGDLESEI